MVLKLIFAITFLLLFQNLSAQKVVISDLKLNDSTIYFFIRGTKAKTVITTEKCNIQDQFSSHVGIGYFDGKQLKIYSVSNENSENESALKIDSLESFFTSKTKYFAIYKCNNNYEELMIMQSVCDNFAQQKITFDDKFEIDNGNAFYSTEFCANVIKQTNPKKYNYAPLNVNLDETSAAYLGRETLQYFPVDFFQTQNNCSKIYETFISQQD